MYCLYIGQCNPAQKPFFKCGGWIVYLYIYGCTVVQVQTWQETIPILVIPFPCMVAGHNLYSHTCIWVLYCTVDSPICVEEIT